MQCIGIVHCISSQPSVFMADTTTATATATATATKVAEPDYVTLRHLYRYIKRLPEDMDVQLYARSARRGVIRFAGDEQTETFGEVVYDDWNALDFTNDSPSSRAELLALMKPWLAEHGHAAVTLRTRLLDLPTTVAAVTVLTRPFQTYQATALNEQRRAAPLLAAHAPRDADRAHALLRERYGSVVADLLGLYAVGPLWFRRDELLARYPGLDAHADWRRLFRHCGRGELRQCAVEEGVLNAEFGPRRSAVDRLLDDPAGTRTKTVPAPAAETKSA